MSAVFLLDTRLDRTLRLAETTGYVIHAGFDQRSEVVIGVTQSDPEVQTLLRFALNGSLIERGEWPDRGIGPHARCVEIRSVYQGPPASVDPLVEIDGRPFEGVSCGPFSPDGRRMTYWVWAEGASADTATNKIDQWVIEIDTGERRLLHEGLVHCGGCDSVPGPKWSPSSRFLYFSDVVGGGDRFFLSDVETGTTRQLTDHVPREPFDVPAWSPVADVLVRSNVSRATVMENLAEGKTTVLRDLPWPARFDPTGAFLYSPAWPSETPSAGATTVVHVASGSVFGPLHGTPTLRTYIGVGGPPIERHPVVGARDGFVAALLDAPGCLGTAIYRNAELTTCVVNAIRPEIAPDGTKIALARATGEAVTPDVCSACAIREMVVIDALSGKEIVPASRFVRVVMSDEAFSSPSEAVEYSWDRSGTHLLVRGPAAG